MPKDDAALSRRLLKRRWIKVMVCRAAAPADPYNPEPLAAREMGAVVVK